ncbi:superoxide dismutase family protein [Alkalibacillus salilacus]|uniref:superoxide dismutase family protein n=1 Tax=Alkalibacillus salilacus TaxID=284582 RepID=UPI0027D7C67D|nr:superoxide dismutase family protein [Alkalibacillus salilacus]
MKWIFLCLMIFLTACGGSPSVYKADIINSNYDVVGETTLSEDANGVNVKVELVGLSPGFHGIHIHENPTCEGPTFESAGGHWSNSEEAVHGLMQPEDHHIGDMPNMEVEASGEASYEYVVEKATLQDGSGSLFNENGGKALIIHSGQDDGVSQPAGDSGDRVACAEITKGEKDEETDNPAEGVEEDQEE